MDDMDDIDGMDDIDALLAIQRVRSGTGSWVVLVD